MRGPITLTWHSFPLIPVCYLAWFLHLKRVHDFYVLFTVSLVLVYNIYTLL